MCAPSAAATRWVLCFDSFLLSLKYCVCKPLTLQLVMQISVLGASPPWYKSRSAAQQSLARQMSPCSASSRMAALLHVMRLRCGIWPCSMPAELCCLISPEAGGCGHAFAVLRARVAVLSVPCAKHGGHDRLLRMLHDVATMLYACCQLQTSACCMQELPCPCHQGAQSSAVRVWAGGGP